MNSQTHVIMGALLFGKKMPKLAWVAAAGGILPDLPMFVSVGVLRLSGYGFDEIFGRIYWEQWWQTANAIGHNFLLWTAVLTGALIIRPRSSASFPTRADMVVAFSSSALVHSVIDFLCHRNDAHMHFWPITDWRFVSPISYWDPAHYGREFGLFEALLGLTMAALLFRQYRKRYVRIGLLCAMTLYAAVPAFFIYNHTGH